MKRTSTRREIIKLLCDTQIFPSGTSGFSWEFSDIIKPLISDDAYRNTKNFRKSVCQALETMYEYPYCNNHREVKRVNVKPPKDKKIYRNYVVRYTLM